MRDTDSGDRRSKALSRIGWLLAILVVALLAGPALMLTKGPSKNEDGSPIRYEPTDWICDVYVGDTRHLASDKDRDGLVDCFYAVVPLARGYRSPDYDGRCTRSFRSSQPMSESMRASLTRILELKYAQGDTKGHADDIDADGKVDCVRNFPRGRVLVNFEGGLCNDADEWTYSGDAAAGAAWNEVLDHANRVRAEVASTGS